MIVHLGISLLSWLIGMVLAGGLGYGFALAGHRMVTAWPRPARFLALLPWRAALVALLLLLPFIPMTTGLGPKTDVIALGLALFVFALPVTTVYFLQEWHPASLRSRLFGLARFLMVASVVALVYSSQFAGGGTQLSQSFIRGLQTLHRASLQAASWTLVLMSLALDVLLGAAQMILRLNLDE